MNREVLELMPYFASWRARTKVAALSGGVILFAIGASFGGESRLAAISQVVTSANPGQTLLAIMQTRSPEDRTATRLIKQKKAMTASYVASAPLHKASRLIPGRIKAATAPSAVPFAIGPLTRPVDLVVAPPDGAEAAPGLGLAGSPETFPALALALPGFGGSGLSIASPIGSTGPAPAPTPIAAVTPSAPAVPEPATWALLIAGFGMIGAMMRRRRGAASEARQISFAAGINRRGVRPNGR